MINFFAILIVYLTIISTIKHTKNITKTETSVQINILIIDPSIYSGRIKYFFHNSFTEKPTCIQYIGNTDFETKFTVLLTKLSLLNNKNKQTALITVKIEQ